MEYEEIEGEVMEFEVFETNLYLDYAIEMCEFWRNQYQLMTQGYEGVKLHDTTLAILG